MNERVKELFEQAGFPKFDIKNEAERFAELIVEECIVIMNREIDEEESKEKNRTISDMMDLLEKHFGVEE